MSHIIIKGKKMKKRIKYRRLSVIVEIPDKKLKCAICGKSDRKLDFHHYNYEFTTDQVRKNPQLALKNTLVLCYPHHKVADAFRIFETHLEEVDILMDKLGIKYLEFKRKQK